MTSRRRWLQAMALGVVAIGRDGGAQQRSGPPQGLADTSNLFAGMDPTAARSVRLPPKPGVSPSMTPDERDALEHRIRCQCGCTLDVFTCRTTDFSCQVSPAMHRDVLALVEGGHGAQEILEAFVNVYGERALMAPTKTGFNLVAYILPGAAIAAGAILLAVMLRHWKRSAALASASAAPPVTLGGTPDEMARLQAAIRDDS